MRRRFHIILLLIGCFAPFTLAAQPPYMGINNLMEVDQKVGCAPLEFTITHPNCGTGNCIARFRDPNTNALLKDTVFTSGDMLKIKTVGQTKVEIITTFSGNNDEIVMTTLQNIKPSFELYACQSGSIQVKITDTQYDHYKINGAGPEATLDQGDPPFEYLFPGPQPNEATILVRGVNDNMADNCADSAKTVPVAVLPPINITEVNVLSSSSISLVHNADDAIQYRLMAAPNNAVSFQFVKTIYDPPSTTETITSIVPDNNYYCLRMDRISPCGGANTSMGSSNVVCSIRFNATAQNNYNALSWATGPGASALTLYKDAAMIPLTNSDYDVECNVPYAYYVTGNFGTAISRSSEKSVTAISTTPPNTIENISSNVEGEQVVLDWQQPAYSPEDVYTIKKIIGPDAGPIAHVNTLAFTDDNYVPAACYTIEYKNACGNSSAVSSPPACPIVLTAHLTKDNTIELSWTAYTGWNQGVEKYEIYEDGTLLTTESGLSYNVVNDATEQVHTYRIVAIPKEVTVPAVNTSSSNLIEVVKAPNLFHPTAFVPGSAFEENRRFKVFSQFTERIEFKIFNRWGELMFYTTDLDSEGWDGTYKGNPMPEGTYVFTAKITDFAGRTFDRSGTIVLLRKAK